MEVLHWPGGSASPLRCSVATLGVFDGVHVGHRHILRRLCEEARRLAASCVVITFDRHPQQVVAGRPEPGIMSLAHRLKLLEELGVDYCLVLQFTPEVAGIEAREFAGAIFRDLLHVRLLVVGPDCRFGRGGEGDAELCRQMAGELGMATTVVEPVEFGREIVSSTAVRNAIQEGDLDRAHRLLGRRFSLLGSVVAGAGRGRKIGYPTANLDVHNELLPPEGVYATWVCVAGRRWASVTSVGPQQTFAESPRPNAVVEVHVMDADLELYGRDIEVQFVQWIREQKRYPSAEALAEQIAVDIGKARRLLS